MSLADAFADAGIVVAIAGTTLVTGWLIYVKMEHRAHYGLSPYDDTDPDALTNYPHCGARTDAGRTDCAYCAEPLDADGRESADAWGDRAETE
ncbi:hypothetical protein C475_10689 [Halosimplex carlsbadense 2-9-1]|uniref:Uncharacterized protein n=1 Tax=Halosimplex carlsbadense 2-9-1 TaxID=797114 RepID=M0CSY1_9EURY|nr:hypothetical protein [Halosimplex carlsbadense]ELZ25492.1 hypothetical protein C475_10689 [Halosimplex carlsbadense 2-9-1]